MVLRSSAVVYPDASKPFSFRDSTFDYIFSEHQIQCLSYTKGLFMLKECLRVLKPGGLIRIVTPDLKTIIGLSTPKKSVQQEQYVKWMTNNFLPDVDIYRESFVINHVFRSWDTSFCTIRPPFEPLWKKWGS